MMRVLAWFTTFMIVGSFAASVSSQFVAGDWVQRCEASIQKYRTTPVSFLVLDAQGKLTPDAKIHIEQLRHHFTLGFELHDGFPAAYNASAQGWRVFNAVSLDGMTTWRQMQPTGPDDFSRKAVDEAMRLSQNAGLKVRWGALVSADVFELPEWVVPLRGQGLSDATRRYVKQISQRYGSSLTTFDIASGTLDQDRLTPAMLRLLAMDAASLWPSVTPSFYGRESFSGGRAFDLVVAIDGLIKQRLGLRAFTLSQAFPPQPVAQDLLEPSIKRLAKLGQPLVVGSLEIAGSHAVETAVNTETVIRTLFAEPLVQGIYFAGLYAPDMADPSAALFDPEHQPAAVARTLDRLFREVWWSDTIIETDALGQAQTRVFLGDYRITATLPDGSTIEVPLKLDTRQEAAEQYVLMPVSSPSPRSE